MTIQSPILLKVIAPFGIIAKQSRARRGLRRCVNIDREHVPHGRIIESGFLEFESLPLEVVQPYQGIQPPVVIDGSTISFWRRALRSVREEVIAYLGHSARLDLVAVHNVHPSRRAERSGAWHTDGVGRRLKFYICLQGDGSTPTDVASISDSSRVGRYSILMDLRWIGLNPLRVNDFNSLRHTPGTRFIFDTDLLHRGHYEGAATYRSALVLEFSDRRKGAVGERFKLSVGPGNNGYDKLHIHEEFIHECRELLLLDESLKRTAVGDIVEYG